MGFIERYVELMEGITDAPKEYQEACALFLLSTMAGRHFIFRSLPDAELFGEGGSLGKFLNLWFIFIGKSRVSRKSTAISRVEEMVRLIDEKLLLPADFTPQAFVKVMNEKSSGGETKAVWINDEISGFFEQLRKGDYMMTTDTLLSRIYDGRSYKRTTITRGEEPIINPYLTVLLASTEYLPSLFDESRIRQGFLNRFIYIPSRKRKRLQLRTSLTREEEKEAKSLLDWLRAVYGRGTQPPLMLGMSTGARRQYDEYEARVEDDIVRENLGMKEGYYGNLPNLLARLASLHRISRMDEGEIKSYSRPLLIIERGDMEWGINYCDKTWGWFQDVVKLMTTTAVSRSVMTEERKIEMVYNIILAEGGEADRSTVYRSANLLSDDLESVLSTLISQGRITQEIVRTATKPRIVYKVVKK